MVETIEARLVTQRAVAKLLSVDERTVTRLSVAGKIPAPIRPTGAKGHLRWDIRELHAWLSRRNPAGGLLSRSEWERVRDVAMTA